MNLKDRFIQFEQAFNKLNEVIEMYKNEQREVYVDAMIQRFLYRAFLENAKKIFRTRKI